MRQTCLCFPITEKEILLGLKKRGFAAGRWNGFGGKILLEETPEDAVVRELEEECGLLVSVDTLEPVARLHFYFNGKPEIDMHTFFVRQWSGTLAETEEMLPRWHVKESLPYERMWSDDIHWLPRALQGEKLGMRFFFRISGEPGVAPEEIEKIEEDPGLLQ